jgi:chemotaxis signal transduction protein
LKGLKIRQGNLIFLIPIENVLHIAPINEVKDELDDIKVVSLVYFTAIIEEENEIVFVNKNDKIFGITVQKVESVVNIKNLNTFVNDIFMIDFILNTADIDEGEGYLLDLEKILEVAYEQKNSSN